MCSATTADQLPQRDDNGVHSERHLEKIACETCHITRSGGITYSMYGHGGHVSFGRNAEGKDTKLITLDHMVADEDDPGDVDADFEAFRLNPVLMWFNGSTSFLAQSLAIRGAPNAKITPFKPMANGMVMDGRFFKGEYLDERGGLPLQRLLHVPLLRQRRRTAINLQLPGMEPFVCSDDGKYGNAEVFSALGLLGTVEDNFGNVIVQGQTPGGGPHHDPDGSDGHGPPGRADHGHDAGLPEPDELQQDRLRLRALPGQLGPGRIGGGCRTATA